MAIAKITLQGAYSYFDSLGDDLFKHLRLPSKMDKETFTDTLFLDYGERPILYTNLPMFQRMIGAWSSKWAIELERIAKTLTDDYEPLWNIDRYEAVTDSINDTSTDDVSETTANTENVESVKNGSFTSDRDSTDKRETENKVSAYNSGDYQPNNNTNMNGLVNENMQGTNTDTDNTDTSSNGSLTSNKSSTYDRDFNHNGHYYGNGGVTTSQSMAIEEVKLRERYNLYHEACKLFANDLLLYVY